MAINQINPSVLRLSGLSSGLDTGTIVDSLLKANQLKLDKQEQLTTKLNWKADALREVNSLIRKFRENNLSVLNSSRNMLSSSAYSIYSVSMLSSNSAVSVSAGANAFTGKLTINNVTQLASQACVKSTGAFAGEKINLSASLKDVQFTNSLEFEDGEVSFSINGETFVFTEDSTLTEVFNAINSSEAGVRIGYSSLTKGFTITSKTTGSDSEVNIVNLSGNVFGSPGLQDGAFGISEGIVNGKNAIMSIEDITVERATNSFTIDGITYTLKDTTNTAISFTVDSNADATVEKVMAFIDEYNTLIEKLQSLISEKTYRAYQPLTDAQKEQMNEKDVKLWEDKAKSGLLQNDASLSSLLNGLRSAFSAAVEGLGVSPSSIGLNTSLYTERGKINVDQDKLRAALEKNPDLVKELFIKNPLKDGAQKFAGSGLVMRISDALASYTQKATNNALAGLDKQISDSKDKFSMLADKLADKETALWRKYTIMEKALSSLYNQQNWLTTMTNSWVNNR